MKLKVEDVNEFMKVVQSCKGPVYLTDWETDENGNYNLQINLKSALSMYMGIAQLLSDYGDWLELHTNNREDEAKLMQFISKTE